MRKGLWSPEEDEKLRRCISKYENGSWNDIARKAGLQRCGRSCRQRWLNHLRPGLKKSKFSTEEVKRILQLHESLGNRWSEIASHLRGRTDNEVKNLWNTMIKRRFLVEKAREKAGLKQTMNNGIADELFSSQEDDHPVNGLSTEGSDSFTSDHYGSDSCSATCASIPPLMALRGSSFLDWLSAETCLKQICDVYKVNTDSLHVSSDTPSHSHSSQGSSFHSEERTLSDDFGLLSSKESWVGFDELALTKFRDGDSDWRRLLCNIFQQEMEDGMGLLNPKNAVTIFPTSSANVAEEDQHQSDITSGDHSRAQKSVCTIGGRLSPIEMESMELLHCNSGKGSGSAHLEFSMVGNDQLWNTTLTSSSIPQQLNEIFGSAESCNRASFSFESYGKYFAEAPTMTSASGLLHSEHGYDIEASNVLVHRISNSDEWVDDQTGCLPLVNAKPKIFQCFDPTSASIC